MKKKSLKSIKSNVTKSPLKSLISREDVHDDALWAEIRKGDMGALHTLYDENLDALYSYGMKLASDDHLVQDCIHDLFLYLWNKRESLGRISHLKGYMFRSMRNLVFKHLKKNKENGSDQTIGGDLTSVEHKFELIPDHSEVLERKELDDHTLREISDFLANLAPRQREVIYLRYYKNLVNQEVADVMGISEQVVRNTLSLIYTKLKQNPKLSKINEMLQQ